MSDMQLLEDGFAVRRGFNVSEYFSSAFGLCKGDRTQQVTLRFSPIKSRWISGQIWHMQQKEKTLKNGSLELTFPVADYAEIMMEILKHGPDVEVIKPQSLRTLIKTAAKKTAKIYLVFPLLHETPAMSFSQT